jgi:hypothetical protein
MRLPATICLLLLVRPVLPLRLPVPAAKATLARRDVLLRASALGAAATASALLAAQMQRLLEPAVPGPEWSDPLMLGLQPTSVDARLEREKLAAEWRRLQYAGRSQTEEALLTVLRVRGVLSEAERVAAAKDDEWAAAIEGIVTAALVAELETASTALAGSAVLSAEARAAVGWQWGACGWRRCGAQADAAQALCKLRANLGMASPLEATFYLDVALRALDEILLLGAAEGLIPREGLPRGEYLGPASLDEVLAVDDEEEGAAEPVHKTLGTRLRAEKQFELEEAMLLEGEMAGSEAEGDEDDGDVEEPSAEAADEPRTDGSASP